MEPWDPNKYVNSDAPSVDPKYKNVTLHRPKPELVGAAKVAKGMLKTGLKMFAAGSEAALASHIDEKYKNQVQFPLTHNNIGYTATNIVVAPAAIAMELKKDPGNEELWGEAAMMVIPFLKVKPRNIIVSAPESIEYAMTRMEGALPSLSNPLDASSYNSISEHGNPSKLEGSNASALFFSFAPF